MRGRLDPEVARAVAGALGREVLGGSALSGGDVAASYRVDVADGRTVFAKTRAGASPDFFVTEAEGLRWLREADALAVPEVLAVGDRLPLLVLAWIDETGGRPASDVTFGRALAALHRAGAPCFGRPDRRPTGSRGLPNEPYDTWALGYAENRLRPLARLATDANALPVATIEGLESIADRLDALAPTDEPPSRLHGDLWAGNRLVDTSGRNWLIDPAAHGGHREFDLAMMRLFGGWAEDAFAAYHEVWPLAEGWSERIVLHQLAPLAVHAIKFGGGYVGATADAVDRYR